MSLGVYIQVPFCQTRCTYCNFHTGVVSSKRFGPYAAAVCQEIREHRHRLAQACGALPDGFAERAVDTVYFGGGTPSLLDAAYLSAMLDAIRETFACAFAEVTLEADPETIVPEKAEAWVAAGINRISIGVQSFSDLELRASGRMHRRGQAVAALSTLRSAGVQNISCDLIAGLPYQTAASWQGSLEELAGLAPEHVSVYLLEVDEGSRLGGELLRGGTRYSAASVPSDEVMAGCYDLARARLRRAGYEHYEISNFAKPGLRSRHNCKYWRREPYLGFGAGAHSFSGEKRWANLHDAAGYVQSVAAGKIPVEQLEEVSTAQALEEELFLGLRQLEGIHLGSLENAYGVALRKRFESLELSGWVERDGDVVRLAPERLSVSNEVFVELMR
jgi:oxygen-independent coproporphyrinogen-3 oxidase